ncbi:MAG: peptidylprolyl isomerase [Sulfuritalea sp.]|jgi:peptidyl-prolyl cis-trans isomerase SurA|nr:peptidylprolyl isomerase [Sulfuritalea sp.]
MKFRILLLCLLSSLAISLAHAQTPRAQPLEVDRIIAVVNDEAITAYELRARLATVERQLRDQKVQLPPREVLEKQLLERMITDRVQLQYAKETGLRVSDLDLDAAMRRIAEGNKLPLQDFRAALEKDGIAWAKFREEIREEIVLSRLREREVQSRVVVTDGEIDNYLANLVAGGGSANIEVRTAHIILRVPEQATPDQLMRIGARARAALDQIRRGDDFAKVAASYSDAPDGLSGGLMGARPLDRLPALYADAVKKLKPGEVSDILRSPAGFHIVKLIDQAGGAAKPVAALKQTRARHILIKVNELVSEAEAKRKLVALKERLENGADFAELARLHSNDLSAAKGGDLGWLYQGDTVPDFEAAMDALKINQISQPVQSPFGFHLIQVLERRTENVTDERQRLAARQVLRERKADEAYQDWVRQIRDRAYVEFRVEER